MPDLSPLVMRHVLRLFAPEDQFEAARLLRDDCSMGNSPALSERVQCAALKLSEGRIDRLYDAIALAQTDWRDLLVAAGFAEGPRAHLAWPD
ncbi:MAG TPA: hypothetical protein VLA52_12165 [Thermohalobaculum sp.]|nr:hypothetical protein [Thermohalobaculum sp.]